MIFRQLFEPQSSTYTYLLADERSREAIIIDPVFENLRREIALIEELRVTPRYTLETHVHADHVTGAWLLREKLGAQIALSKLSEAEGADVYLRRHPAASRKDTAAAQRRSTSAIERDPTGAWK